MKSDAPRPPGNRARLPQILPADIKKSPSSLDDASPSPDQQKQVTKAACNACRKRKSKCSGARPKCGLCKSRGSDCVYNTTMLQETQGQALKRKYNQLQGSSTAYKAIFEFLQDQSETEAEELFRRIRGGTEIDTLISQIQGADMVVAASPAPPETWHRPQLPSITEQAALMRHPVVPNFDSKPYTRRDHLQDGLGEPDGHVLHQSAGPSQIAHLQRASISKTKESIDQTCFHQLFSWKQIPNFTNSDLVDEEDSQSTVLSLPPLPLDAYKSYSHPDWWTQTGWTQAHIHHLFDALYTWDYLPFSLICYDLFLQDFHNGSTRFCSRALVYAILALATRIVNENNDSSEVLPSGWRGSGALFKVAQAQVKHGGPLQNLPDIQALGILSLYEIRNGQEAKAQELAEAFLDNITKFYERQPPSGEDVDQGEKCARVKATTYCGAVSLNRILLIVTGQLFTGGNDMIKEDIPILDQPSHHNEDIRQGKDRPRSHLDSNSGGSELLDLQVISVKIFQLTEWVYKFANLVRSDFQRALSDLESFYTGCLNWYERVFFLLNATGSRTPFVLFVHMYYHFCLLSTLRPFVHLAAKDLNIQPRMICRQAAQSILAVAQSYDDLFTLRRVSALIPYFVCASGLFCIITEGNSSHMASVHLRPWETLPRMKTHPDEDEPAMGYYDSPANTSYVKMSAISHARRLLIKMASTHPAAMVAEKRL